MLTLPPTHQPPPGLIPTTTTITPTFSSIPSTATPTRTTETEVIPVVPGSLERGCLCSVSSSATGERGTSMGCAAHGYLSKWCYIGGSQCSGPLLGGADDAWKFPMASRWRSCSGHKCEAYAALPGLSSLQGLVTRSSALESDVRAKDWPDCCEICSESRDCLAWRFGLSADQSYGCDLFVVPGGSSPANTSSSSTKSIGVAARIADELRAAAVAFTPDARSALPFSARFVYGLPGFDDSPRPCFGFRRGDGLCISFLFAVYLACLPLGIIFLLRCCPVAFTWVRFSRSVRRRGMILRCLSKAERVRHEWRMQKNKYCYDPVFEVKLLWELPSGKPKEMVYTGIHETDHLFDGTVGKLMRVRRLVPSGCAGSVAKFRAAPRSLYIAAAGTPHSVPDPGHFRMEVPSHWPQSPRPVPAAGLADCENPDIVVPFSDGRKDIGSIVSWRHGIGYSACGCLAFIPVLFLCTLKLAEPLLPLDGLPVAMEGFWGGPGTNKTRSRFATLRASDGRWDLKTTTTVMYVLTSLLVVCCLLCAFPWWLIIARSLLQGVPCELPGDFVPDCVNNADARLAEEREGTTSYRSGCGSSGCGSSNVGSDDGEETPLIAA